MKQISYADKSAPLQHTGQFTKYIDEEKKFSGMLSAVS